MVTVRARVFCRHVALPLAIVAIQGAALAWLGGSTGPVVTTAAQAPQGPVSQGRGPGPGGPGGPGITGRGRGPIFDQAAIARARIVFEPLCGFCHGNDARGRAGGPDLARSLIVIGDTKGNELGPFIRAGRPERGMPPFPNLTQEQLSDIAEFLHERVQAARNRAVIDPKASVVGDPAAGVVYFNGAGKCISCHSVTGDLAGIGAKYDPMTLQDRLVNPRPGGRGAAANVTPRAARTAAVTLPSGEIVTGRLDFISEFAVTVLESSGRRRSFTRNGDSPRVVVTDPLQAHYDLMRSYNDNDLHDLTAYLVTIR